ncbi:hypothetical protein BN2537_16953 [Streptomyces venezuelae]|nr:hypothetical protein BN2537_16953 [Streptomyces venezuelae]
MPGGLQAAPAGSGAMVARTGPDRTGPDQTVQAGTVLAQLRSVCLPARRSGA